MSNVDVVILFACIDYSYTYIYTDIRLQSAAGSIAFLPKVYADSDLAIPRNKKVSNSVY